METSLHQGVARFRQDFDSELSRASSTFQLQSSSTADDLNAQVTQRCASWSARDPYPKLLRAVFVAQPRAAGGFQLFRFEPVPGELKECEWPAELASVKNVASGVSARTNELLRNLIDGSFSRDLSPKVPVIHYTSPMLVETIPAVISFFSPDSIKPDDSAHRPALQLGYAILELDSEYIRQESLPALAHKYFSTGNRLDFNIAVVRQAEPHEITYQSDPAYHVPDPPSGDASEGLFSSSLDDFRLAPERESLSLAEGHPGADAPGAPKVLLGRALTVRMYTNSDTLRSAPK